MKYRLHIDVVTEFVRDNICIPCGDDDADVAWLLAETKRRFELWHPFKVYGFELKSVNAKTQESLLVAPDTHLASLLLGCDLKSLQFVVEESVWSRKRREEDELREKEQRERLIAEKRLEQKLRAERIANLENRVRNRWALSKVPRHIEVPVEDDGFVALNKGSLDQWASVGSLRPIRPLQLQRWPDDPAEVHDAEKCGESCQCSEPVEELADSENESENLDQFEELEACENTEALPRQHFCSVTILNNPSSTNTWRFCVGVVPLSFDFAHDRRWVGAQKSWAYIGGTGGKCRDSGKSTPYGDPFSAGDTIGILLDFDARTVEFFKNGVSQGVAFRDLCDAPVRLAVSITAKGCKVRFNREVPPRFAALMHRYRRAEQKRRVRWQNLLSEQWRSLQLRHARRTGTLMWDAPLARRKDDSLWFPSPNAPDTLPSLREPVVPVRSKKKRRSKRDKKKSDAEAKLGRFARVRRRLQSEPKEVAKKEAAVPEMPPVPPLPQERHSEPLVQSEEMQKQQNMRQLNQVARVVLPDWAYIAGTGGMAFNSGQSTPYGEKFSTGDRVGVLVDLDEGTLEFFRNGESQGVAFRNVREVAVGVGHRDYARLSSRLRAVVSKERQESLVRADEDDEDKAVDDEVNRRMPTLLPVVFPCVSVTGTGARLRICTVLDVDVVIAEYRRKQEERQLRAERLVASHGNVWDADRSKCTPGMQVDPSCPALVSNTDDSNKWRSIASVLTYSRGRRYFEVQIARLTATSNTWKMCIGVVPKHFDFKHPKVWVGAQRSWAYIVGTGGKTFNSGKSSSYGRNLKAKEGDRVGVLMDFDNCTLEFFLNGTPLGEAFDNLAGPVSAAVSMTGNGSQALLDAAVEFDPDKMEQLVLFQ
ncbi:MAG: hypothetical protein MHM6MM_001536 [Cercozoa sp. M6MM]